MKAIADLLLRILREEGSVDLKAEHVAFAVAFDVPIPRYLSSILFIFDGIEYRLFWKSRRKPAPPRFFNET